MTRDEIRNQINARPLTDFIGLQKSANSGAGFYNCPVCGSGTGKNKTGALKIYPNNRVFCYSRKCFSDKGEDTLGALKIIWACDETEAMRRAKYSPDDSAPPPVKKKDPPQSPAPARDPDPDYTQFYEKAHADLLSSPEALAYLHDRGITDESINRFNLGYCAAWKHSKAGPNVPSTRRIIIPRTKRTYTARRIDKPESEYEMQYVKQVQGHQKDLFNLDALSGSDIPWIVEGELDAISLLQAGAEAVIGIGTVTNTGRLLEEAKKYPDKNYILALDADEAGRSAQAELAQSMKAAGLVGSAMKSAFYGSAKDGNEAFLKDPDALRRNIALIEADERQSKQLRDEKRRENLDKRTGPAMLDSFLRTAKSRDFEPIPTGIIDIDRATAGGLTRRTLVLLSGAPGLGKTCLAQAISENIAKTGRDCLFLNLEMDRNQLLARSLARIAWTMYKADLSPLEILRGYEWTAEKEEAIMKSAALYRKEIAPHMIYNPDELTNSLDSILQVMKAEAQRIKAEGRPVPIVIIDYLNLIDANERDATEGLKKVIYSLKDFAKLNNTVVLAITATNRASNRSGTVEMESGRDTSAVEYSGDLMLGISYTAIEDGRTYDTGETDRSGKPIMAKYDIDELRRLRREAYERGENPPPVCSEISLKVLKNRFGEPDRRAKLHFDGRHNLYTMAYVEAKQYENKDWKTIIK